MHYLCTQKKRKMNRINPILKYVGRHKYLIVVALGGKVDSIDNYVDALMVAKYLEKIADHGVNIANWEIFQETGDMEDERLL